jgi:hypothetical protein
MDLVDFDFGFMSVVAPALDVEAIADPEETFAAAVFDLAFAADIDPTAALDGLAVVCPATTRRLSWRATARVRGLASDLTSFSSSDSEPRTLVSSVFAGEGACGLDLVVGSSSSSSWSSWWVSLAFPPPR